MKRAFGSALAASAAALALLVACSDGGNDVVGPQGGAALAKMNGNDFYQCQTGNPRSPACNWISGTLNATHNQYFEDDVIPQKIRLDEAVGKTRVILEYGFRKGGSDAGGNLSGDYHGNYDFMGSYDAGTGPSNPCTGDTRWAFFCTATTSTGTLLGSFPGGIDAETVITGDVSGLTPAEQAAYAAALSRYGAARRQLMVLNATDLRIDSLRFTRGGDATIARIVFEFTAPATQSQVGILFGMHFSFEADWGGGHGAAGQSGSPFHTKIVEVRTGIVGNDYTTGKVLNNGAMAINVSGDVVRTFPSLSLSKSSTVSTVNAGDTVNYTITINNGGTAAASGVVITDSLPGAAGLDWFLSPANTPAECAITGAPGSEVLSCTFPSIAAGASRSVTVKSLTTSATCGQISNTARATATGTTVSGSPAGPVTIQVNCPNISLTKAAQNDTVNAGDFVRFTLTTANGGPGSAFGVMVTDTLPTTAGLSWSIAGGTGAASCSTSAGVLTCNYGTMAAGTSLTVTLESATTGATCGTVTNRGHVATGNNGSDSDTAEVVVQCSSVSLLKAAADDTVTAGDSIRFTLTASNAGPGSATGVVVTDTLPATAGLNWTIGGGTGAASCSIAGGVLTCNYGAMAAGTSLSVILRSPTTSASCGTVTNRGHVATGNDGSDSDTARVEVQCANVSLLKTALGDTVSAGDTIRFSLVASNAGPGTAQGVVVTDSLPTTAGLSWAIAGGTGAANCSIAGGVLTCNYGTMAAGTSLTVNLESATTGATCGTVLNRGHVSTANDGSGSDTADVLVQCPNLAISKSAVAGSVQAGDTARFTVTVTNNGAGVARDVVLTDTLPNSGLSWAIQGTTGSPTCTPFPFATVSGRQVLRCTMATLASGASFSVTVKSHVPASYLLQPPSPAGSPLEIDGNLLDDAAPGKDWASVGLNCLSNPAVGCDLDLPTGRNDNAFGQGTKEDTQVPTVVSGSIPNNKSDLLRFYVADERFGTTDFLYLAWERVQAPTGTTNMDFELNQSPQLSSNGVTPVRTAGDLLIKFDLAKGGTVPTLGFHRWVTAASAGGQTPSQACEASNSFPCWSKVTALTSNVAAAVNTSSVSDPIAPDAPRTLDPLTFGEARINLQATGIFQAGVCVNFGQAYLKSRSSDAFTSEIKDFIAPIPVEVSNCAPANLDNRAWAVAAFVTAVSDTARIVVSEDGSSVALLAGPASGREAGAGVTAPLPAGGTMVAVASLDRSEVREARPAGEARGDRTPALPPAEEAGAGVRAAGVLAGGPGRAGASTSARAVVT